MSLAENREELIDLIQEQLAIVASGDPVDELGEAFEFLADGFQALASCNLLLTMQTEGFDRNLYFSGCTRRYFLRRCQSETANPSRYRAISRTDSFLDAIVAGRIPLANEIHQFSNVTWVPSGEYEDDFCYRAFLQHFVAGLPEADNATLDPLLQQFERALEGDSSVRLDVCQALRARDDDGFQAAFVDLIQVHAAEAEQRRPRAAVDKTIESRDAVFVEGLALLWIAGQLGFTLEPEYEGCPSVARQPRPAQQLPDIYDEIDKIIRQ